LECLSGPALEPHQLKEISNEIKHERLTAPARRHLKTQQPEQHHCRGQYVAAAYSLALCGRALRDEAVRPVAFGCYSPSQRPVLMAPATDRACTDGTDHLGVETPKEVKRRAALMVGRTVLVTGGSGGIGKATAVGLARMGADLAIIGRDRGRTEDAAKEIRAAGGGRVDLFVADLSSQSQVRELAEQVLQNFSRIHVLINNVGGYFDTRQATADGIERTFALNHLAPFLLTNLLLEKLKLSYSARVVTVSSNAQAAGCIDFSDLQGERSYNGARAYSQSKLANVLFSYELARRLKDTTVTANALHPGLVNTSFGAEDPSRVQRILVPLLRPFMKSPAQGAATSIHMASAPELEQVTGRYFAARHATKSSKPSYDQATAARLWQVSADLVGLPAAPSPARQLPLAPKI
jgi:retinol dehydrogenase 14